MPGKTKTVVEYAIYRAVFGEWPGDEVARWLDGPSVKALMLRLADRYAAPDFHIVRVTTTYEAVDAQ